MNKTVIAGILILISAVVLYQYAPGGGWQGDGTPLYTIAQGCVNGGVYVKGGHGLTYENPYIEYFEVPDGAVLYARLYIPVWNFKPGDTLELTLNGNNPEVNSEPDYTAAWGVTGYSLNVTRYINTGMNEVQVRYDNPNGGPYCVMLVVVYEDRIEKKEKEIRFIDIKKVEEGFMTVDKAGKETNIPVHRVRIVLKKGKLIWKRNN